MIQIPRKSACILAICFQQVCAGSYPGKQLVCTGKLVKIRRYIVCWNHDAKTEQDMTGKHGLKKVLYIYIFHQCLWPEINSGT